MQTWIRRPDVWTTLLRRPTISNRRRKPSRRSPTTSAAAVPATTTQRLVEEYHRYTIPLYPRPELVLAAGKGSYVVDFDGKEYLDFSGGIAVNALGHCEQRILEAVTSQASKITHMSNLFHTEPSIALAKRLVENSFGDKVYLCNSGTEATEAAIKFARKWAATRSGIDPYAPDETGPHEIVSFTSGFHGRTLGALSITPKQKIQAPFRPLLPGSRVATFNDLASAEAAIKAGRTCAVFVEPVQGEGGVCCATTEFLKGLRALCDRERCLLVFDEVQSGFGRSGKLWAHERHGVFPDIMTLAKPLAGGLPIGAVVVTDDVSDTLKPGDHGSTFAGNALICHVANTVFDIVNDTVFLASVDRNSEVLAAAILNALQGHPRFVELRHCGLLAGVQCDGDVSDIVDRALKAGLIVITAGQGNVIRLAPPLNVTESEIDACVKLLVAAFN